MFRFKLNLDVRFGAIIYMAGLLFFGTVGYIGSRYEGGAPAEWWFVMAGAIAAILWLNIRRNPEAGWAFAWLGLTYFIFMHSFHMTDHHPKMDVLRREIDEKLTTCQVGIDDNSTRLEQLKVKFEQMHRQELLPEFPGKR
jgi:hypothetical protein